MGTINLTWWNLQNFFDTDDDPISKDFEYTPAEGWTPEVFAAKRANLAAALAATHQGRGPELLAVCEIEKDGLLEELIEHMGKSHLKVVRDPAGTRDLRGIDVAVAYDNRKLKPRHVVSHLVHLRYRTRDLLEIDFEIKDTGEHLILIACHWPSRSRGRYWTEPLRIAVAEHVAYLVESWVKVAPEEYEELRGRNDIDEVRQKWETKVLVVGDLNDEPYDRSIAEHLKASNELDRAIGKTNDIDGFKEQTADYRAQEVFLYNAVWDILARQGIGTYFLEGSRTGGRFTNRHQVLDQIIVSRGLVTGEGLRLDTDSVRIFADGLVATGSGRPRRFDKKKAKGCSDHLPITAVLEY